MDTDKARIRTCNLTRPVGHQYPSREWPLCGTASTLLAINLRNIASWFAFFSLFSLSILRNYAINKGQALPSNSKIRSRKRLWIIWKGILYNRAFFPRYLCTCRRVRSFIHSSSTRVCDTLWVYWLQNDTKCNELNGECNRWMRYALTNKSWYIFYTYTHYRL